MGFAVNRGVKVSDSDKQVSKGAGKEVASSKEVSAFLQKVSALPTVNTGAGQGRLIFALDATGSRENTWDQATQLQAEMFTSTQAIGKLQVQLCYFRGFMEFYHSEWCHEAAGLLKIMTGIRCHAGTTQIERLMQHALDETRRARVHSLVFVGDAMEENTDVLCQLAGQLGLYNVPVFIFQEGHDVRAEKTFKEMARLSKGAYSHFDASSIDQLKDLLRAVAVYATGGLKALQHFSKNSHPAVKLLGQQLGK